MLSFSACSSASGETETPLNTTTVQRGNLTNVITAAGNLALSITQNLAVDLFYQQGTITEVLVDVGDSVEEGQVLVRIDPDEWQEQLDNLESSLATAERTLTSRQRALASAERQLTAAERSVTSKELAYRQAEIDVATAEYNLNQIKEIKAIQTQIENAEYAYNLATSMLAGDFVGSVTLTDLSYWSLLQTNAAKELEEARKDLEALLAGTGISSESLSIDIASKQLQIEQRLLALEEAELAMQYAQDDLSDAATDVEYARADVELAVNEIDSLTATLEEARAKSPEIVAPFDGFIVAVNVSGGDEVIRGTVAVQVADPARFQADIYVNEVEIRQVALGTSATVTADAVPEASFPAAVTYISPTATISSGVVNYVVRVELSSLEDLAASFTPPADMEAPEGMTPPEGFEFPEGSEMPSGSFGQASTEISSALEDLRDGMSVTVSLILSNDVNVLLVPYTSVATVAGKSYVQVVLENGEIEQREVTTGSTDYTSIVIISGLTEGETIVVPEGTVSAGVSSPQNQFGGGMMIPGIGGGR